jgi:capsular polysaccharide biosynthesis protein
MIIKNGIVTPENFCVYDSTGTRINDSCVIRESGLIYDPALKIPVAGCEYIDEDVVYSGVLPFSFGHFLTEGAGRLWDIDRPAYHHEKKGSAVKSRLLELADIKTTTILKKLRFRSIKIPKSSFQNRLSFSQEHTIIFERIARKINPDVNTKGLLYLSRSKLSNQKRKVINETDIESLIDGTVIYPEKLSIEEQITLINEHSVIVGCLGAALHLLLFRLSPPKRVVVLWRSEKPNTYPNYLFIDKMKNIESEYHFVLSFDKNCKKPSGKRNMVADIEKIQGILK